MTNHCLHCRWTLADRNYRRKRGQEDECTSQSGQKTKHGKKMEINGLVAWVAAPSLYAYWPAALRADSCK